MVKKKTKQKVKEKVSMKEALNGIPLKKVSKKLVKKFSLRDWFWNYPVFFQKVFKKLIPFSYIVVFGVLGLGLSLTLQSNVMADLLKNSSNKSTLIEGCVGSSSTLNPLFVSVNDIDKSIQNLVFEKFIDLDKQGNPVSNIAKSWSISDNGLIYDFVINDDLYWQDGQPLIVDDVVYTFNTAISLYEDYNYDSVGSSLSGITVEKKDNNTISFTLEDESPTFLEAVSIYIVPKHRLEKISLGDMPFDVFAKYPIGSGKYRVVRNDDNYISLKDSDVDEVVPNIKNIVFKMYSDFSNLEAAFRNDVLDSFGVLDIENVSFVNEYENMNVFTESLELRNKMIFLNNRNGKFENKGMRIGLSYLLDIHKLLEESEIKGTEVISPIPSSSWAFNKDVTNYSYNLEKAQEYLKNAGYTKNSESGYFESDANEILSFTISYFKSSKNDRLVDALVEMFLEEGVVLKKEPLNYSQISQEIIATRDFEMLLYEVETMIDPDQYNLWHSLKKNYPDLNISGYEYERVDILLEEARATRDRSVRKEKYDLFQKYLMDDVPVLFLYHPSYSYFVDKDLHEISIDEINYPYQRFNLIEDWYWN